jgi:hypothetical protein
LRAKKEVNYNATYFLHMLAEHGGLETARRLITTTTSSEGFTVLWERQRLDLTVEGHVVQSQFRELFTADEVEAAASRLAAFLHRNALRSSGSVHVDRRPKVGLWRPSRRPTVTTVTTVSLA